MLPAHAGMVPGSRSAPASPSCAPRARGDGPLRLGMGPRSLACSPRTRGWSRPVEGDSVGPLVLPAHAGMVPSCVNSRRSAGSAPRARGDGPGRVWASWARSGCSPRTRGWSRDRIAAARAAGVLPAHAGMVPVSEYVGAHHDGAPRARGDGPSPGRWMRRADVCAPRARGDGPRHRPPRRARSPCSPRTRGWSRQPLQTDVAQPVLPAHAGMVPPAPRRAGGRRSAPRARGDGPDGQSPGKSPSRWVPVLPAHAGMVPRPSRVRPLAGGAPRARGDGPEEHDDDDDRTECSPRTRGWSRAASTRTGRPLVLPARAGVTSQPGSAGTEACPVPAPSPDPGRGRARPRNRGS